MIQRGREATDDGAMEATEIGDLTLAPWQDRLRLTIAAQRDTTTLTVHGVRAVLAYLHAWLAAYETDTVCDQNV